MQPFAIVTGSAAPLLAANIDTDVIMPKQFLKGIDRNGLAHGLFFDLRLLPSGAPNPDFVLNQPAWEQASFLVTGANFGCGSSREHAVWGLMQRGIRALIGSSFAGIFQDNCQRNGVLTIELNEAQLARVASAAGNPASATLSVDLPRQEIRLADGAVIAFAIDELKKRALLLGLDAIGTTLQRAAQIRTFEQRHLEENPWL